MTRIKESNETSMDNSSSMIFSLLAVSDQRLLEC